MKKKIILVFLFLVFILALSQLYYWPFYKIIDYIIPSNIKGAIETKELSAINLNLSPIFTSKYLLTHSNEYRLPLVLDFYERLRNLTFVIKRPVVLVHQTFYSHIYNQKGLNFLCISIVSIKNIGSQTAVVDKITIDIDSETKHNYNDPDFSNSVPIVLFPNEEIFLLYGQEIPPGTFSSDIVIEYNDLTKRSLTFGSFNKIHIKYDFNRKIYQFL